MKSCRLFQTANVLIFASPVYVYHATVAMKALPDRYGWRWMVARPEGKMFSKQAVCENKAFLRHASDAEARLESGGCGLLERQGLDGEKSSRKN